MAWEAGLRGWWGPGRHSGLAGGQDTQPASGLLARVCARLVRKSDDRPCVRPVESGSGRVVATDRGPAGRLSRCGQI